MEHTVGFISLTAETCDLDEREMDVLCQARLPSTVIHHVTRLLPLAASLQGVGPHGSGTRNVGFVPSELHKTQNVRRLLIPSSGDATLSA